MTNELLIKNTKFREKIERLLKLGSYQSNCFGTVSNVFGIEKDIDTFWEELKQKGLAQGSFSQFLEFYNQNLPGWIGTLPFKLYLEKNPNVRIVERPSLDDLVVFSDMSDEWGATGVQPVHAGIYLGDLDKENMIFHQRGSFGDFGIDSFKDVADNYQKNSESWTIRYYQINEANGGQKNEN